MGKRHIDGLGTALVQIAKQANRYRNDGLAKALTIVEKGGIEALRHEVDIRNAYFIPLEIDSDLVTDVLDKNIIQQGNEFQDVLMVEACMALHDKFRFGPKRLKEFAEMLNYHISCVNDRDKHHEHYVKILDHAEYLNEECDSHFDLNRIRQIEEAEDRSYEKERK